MVDRASGRCTFTATSSPVALSLALYTCRSSVTAQLRSRDSTHVLQVDTQGPAVVLSMNGAFQGMQNILLSSPSSASSFKKQISSAHICCRVPTEPLMAWVPVLFLYIEGGGKMIAF